MVESLGSYQLGEVYEDQLRFPLVVRLLESVRRSPETIRNIEINTPTGQRIPLSRLAEIKTIKGPSTITREWGYRRVTISSNIRGRDMGGFVAEAQAFRHDSFIHETIDGSIISIGASTAQRLSA